MKRTIHEVVIKNYDSALKREVKLSQHENEFSDDDAIMQGADFDAVDRSFLGYSSVSQQEALKELFNFIAKEESLMQQLLGLPIFKTIDWGDSPDAACLEYTAQIDLNTGEITLTDETVHPLNEFTQYEGTFEYDSIGNTAFAISYESANHANKHLLKGLIEMRDQFQTGCYQLEDFLRVETKN